MNCPHCSAPIEFETYVLYNVEVYGKPVIGKTKCCGKGLRVSRKISFEVSVLNEYDGEISVDSWGEELSK